MGENPAGHFNIKEAYIYIALHDQLQPELKWKSLWERKHWPKISLALLKEQLLLTPCGGKFAVPMPLYYPMQISYLEHTLPRLSPRTGSQTSDKSSTFACNQSPTRKACTFLLTSIQLRPGAFLMPLSFIL